MDTSSACSTDALEGICNPLRRVPDSTDHRLDCCQVEDLPDLAQCPGVSARPSQEDCSRLQSQEVEDFVHLAQPLSVASLRAFSSTDEALVHRQLQLSEPGTYMGLAPPRQHVQVQGLLNISSGINPQALLSLEQLQEGSASLSALSSRGVAAVSKVTGAGGATEAVVRHAGTAQDPSAAEMVAADEQLLAQTPPSNEGSPLVIHMAQEAAQLTAARASKTSNAQQQSVPHRQSSVESSSTYGLNIARTSSWQPGRTQVGFSVQQQLPEVTATQPVAAPALPTATQYAAAAQHAAVPAAATWRTPSRHPAALLQPVQQQQEQQGAPAPPAVLLRQRTSSNASSGGGSATSTPRATAHLVSPGLQARIRAAELAAAGRFDPISWAAAEAEAIQADTEAAEAAARQVQQQHLEEELQKRKAEAARVAVQLAEAKEHFSGGGAAATSGEVHAAVQLHQVHHQQQDAKQEGLTQLLQLHRKSVPGRLVMTDYSTTLSTDGLLSESSSLVESRQLAPGAAVLTSAATQPADADEVDSSALGVSGTSPCSLTSLAPPEALLQDISLVVTSSLFEGSRGSSPQPGHFPDAPVLGHSITASNAVSGDLRQPIADGSTNAEQPAAGAGSTDTLAAAVRQLLQPAVGGKQVEQQQQQQQQQQSQQPVVCRLPHSLSSPTDDVELVATSTASAVPESAEQASQLSSAPASSPDRTASKGTVAGPSTGNSSPRAASNAANARPAGSAGAKAAVKRPPALSLARQQQQEHPQQSGGRSPTAVINSRSSKAVAESSTSSSKSLSPNSPAASARAASKADGVSPQQSPRSPIFRPTRLAGSSVWLPQESPRPSASGASSVSRGSGLSPQQSPGSPVVRPSQRVSSPILSPQQSPNSPASGKLGAPPSTKAAAAAARPAWNSNTRIQTGSVRSSPKAGGSTAGSSRPGTPTVRSPLTSPPPSPSVSRLSIGIAAPSRIPRLAGGSSSSKDMALHAGSVSQVQQPLMQGQPSQGSRASCVPPLQLPQQQYISSHSPPAAAAAGTAESGGAAQAAAPRASEAEQWHEAAVEEAQHAAGLSGQEGAAAAAAVAGTAAEVEVAAMSPALPLRRVNDMQRFNVLDFSAGASNRSSPTVESSNSLEPPPADLGHGLGAQEVSSSRASSTSKPDHASERGMDKDPASGLQQPQADAAAGASGPECPAARAADDDGHLSAAEPAELVELASADALVAQAWPQSHKLLTSSFGIETTPSCLVTGQQPVHADSSSIAALPQSHQLMTGSYGLDTTASCLVTGQSSAQADSSSGAANGPQSTQPLANKTTYVNAITSLLPYGLAVVKEECSGTTVADAVEAGPQSFRLMTSTMSIDTTASCLVTGQVAAADASGPLDNVASSMSGTSNTGVHDSMQTLPLSQKLVTGSYRNDGSTSFPSIDEAPDLGGTEDASHGHIGSGIGESRVPAGVTGSSSSSSNHQSGPAATAAVLERTAAMLQHHYLRINNDVDCLLMPPDLVVDRLSPRSPGPGCIAAAALSRNTSAANSAAHSRHSSMPGSPVGSYSPPAHSRSSSLGGIVPAHQHRGNSSGTGSVGGSAAYSRSGSLGGSQLRNVSRHVSAVGFGPAASQSHLADEASAVAAAGAVAAEADAGTANSGPTSAAAEPQHMERSSSTAAVDAEQQPQQLVARIPGLQDSSALYTSGDSSGSPAAISPSTACNSSSSSNGAVVGSPKASNPSSADLTSSSSKTAAVAEQLRDISPHNKAVPALPATAAAAAKAGSGADAVTIASAGSSADLLLSPMLLGAVPQKLLSRHSSTQSLESDHAQHDDAVPLSEQPTNSPPHFMMSLSMSCSPHKTADTLRRAVTDAAAAVSAEGSSNKQAAAAAADAASESTVSQELLQQMAAAARLQQQQQHRAAADIDPSQQQQRQQQRRHRGSGDSVSGHLKLQQLIPQKPKPRQQQMPARIFTWGADVAPAAAVGPSEPPHSAAAVPLPDAILHAAVDASSSSVRQSSSGSPAPAPTAAGSLGRSGSVPVAIMRPSSGRCRHSSTSIPRSSSGGSSASNLADSGGRHQDSAVVAALIADDNRITSSFKQALLESICSSEDASEQQQEQGGRCARSSHQKPAWQQQQQISNVVAFSFPRTSSTPAFGNRNSLGPCITGSASGSSPQQQQQQRPVQVVRGSYSYYLRDSPNAAAADGAHTAGVSYYRRWSAGAGSSDAAPAAGEAILTAAPMLRLSQSSNNIQTYASSLPTGASSGMGFSQQGTAASLLSRGGSQATAFTGRSSKELSFPAFSPISEGTNLSEGTNVSVATNLTAYSSSSGDGSSGAPQQQQQQQQGRASLEKSKRQQGLLSAQMRRSSSSSSPVAAGTAPAVSSAAQDDGMGILALLASPPISAVAAPASDAAEAVPAEGRVRGKNSAAAALLGLGIITTESPAGIKQADYQQQQQQQVEEHEQGQQTPRGTSRVFWAGADESPHHRNGNTGSLAAATAAATDSGDTDGVVTPKAQIRSGTTAAGAASPLAAPTTPCSFGRPPMGPSRSSSRKKVSLIRTSKSCMEFSSLVAAAAEHLHQQRQGPAWSLPGAAAGTNVVASSSGRCSPRQQQQQQQQVNIFTEAYAAKGAVTGTPPAAAAGSSTEECSAPAAASDSLATPPATTADCQQQTVVSQAVVVPAGRPSKSASSGGDRSCSAPAEISLLSCSWQEIEPSLDQDHPQMQRQSRGPAVYSFEGNFYGNGHSRARSSSFTAGCSSSHEQQQQWQQRKDKERVDVQGSAGGAPGSTDIHWQELQQVKNRQQRADTSNLQQQVAAAAAAAVAVAVQQDIRPLNPSTVQPRQHQPQAPRTKRRNSWFGFLWPYSHLEQVDLQQQQQPMLFDLSDVMLMGQLSIRDSAQVLSSAVHRLELQTGGGMAQSPY